jgi:hypothetical protein
VEYYKDLFGLEPRPDIRLKPNFFLEEEKVSAAENEILGGGVLLRKRSKRQCLALMLTVPLVQMVSPLCFIKPTGI